MRSLTKSAVFLILTISFQISFSQSANAQSQEEELSLNSGTIDNQFEYIFQKSGNFKGLNGQKYEAVKYNSLLTLKAHVLDSLKTTYAKLDVSEKTVENQKKEIEDLKTQLKNTQTTLGETEAEKNSMALFGIQLGKTNYNVLMWSIIAGLFALLVFFILKFKGSNALTKAAKLKLEEVESEFEEHRRIALEREQKVRRQLQDEINKNKA
ncbi:tRNA (guanine-N1)-methyltransferase [Winogradskyella alexanderae]|uniref:tRNA (Guanine-N1)-methyltransferase n=1 Tax=Winogradskyella alexanderae TaxID=2877123 RepID=A0ABS7XW37_9FLAO|nr:tRNA (guanine-N1)-methyltransferase [Winogradskyella alexanderae]MCA0133046.1 tRNA (guanine-N1)-methyltransferase [Winogradskyella alexanderae]